MKITISENKNINNKPQIGDVVCSDGVYFMIIEDQDLNISHLRLSDGETKTSYGSLEELWESNPDDYVVSCELVITK